MSEDTAAAVPLTEACCYVYKDGALCGYPEFIEAPSDASTPANVTWGHFIFTKQVGTEAHEYISAALARRIGEVARADERAKYEALASEWERMTWGPYANPAIALRASLHQQGGQ